MVLCQEKQPLNTRNFSQAGNACPDKGHPNTFTLVLEYIFYDFFSLSVKSCPPPANWQKWEAAVALSSFQGRPRSWGYKSS